MPISYNDIRENLEKSLSIQNIPYIKDIRKELNSLNTFAMDGTKPETIMEIIGKLIQIKKHPKYSQDKFWIGCAINIHCAYSYRVQIETVYLSIAPSGNDTNVDTKSEEKVETVSTWRLFLEWARKSLTESRFQELSGLQVEESETGLVIYNQQEGIGKEMVSKFFRGRVIEWK